MSDTPESDEARLCGYGYFRGLWVPVDRNCYEKDSEGDVVFCEVAEKLERERDEARRELAAVDDLLEKYDHRFNCSNDWSESDTLGKVDWLIRGYIILHGDSVIQRRKHE